MSKLLIYLFIIIANISYSQVNDLPQVNNKIWFEDQRKQGDTISINTYWSNKNPKILYKEDDLKLIRYEYYKNGQLKCTSEIVQELGIDTTSLLNPESKVYEIVILKTLFDIGNGQYKEYSIKGEMKRMGKLNKSKKIGEWISFDEMRNKYIINYNANGDVDGKYLEYYYDRKQKKYILKIEGQYKTINFTKKNMDKVESRRTGKWKYFSIEGELIEESNYIN